jgi:flagellar hook-associated protein 3 FlgL
MTVADLTLFDTLSFSLDSVASSLQQTEIQLATGRRVNSPSDDPVAYGESVILNAQQSALNNDVNLAQQIQGKLNTADATLSSAANAIESALAVATQGADATISASQMATLAKQVNGQLAQLIEAANLQYGGAYVFGGHQTLTAPYNASGAYSGDSGSNQFSFSSGASVHLTYDGRTIFGDSSSGAIGLLVSLEAALDAGDKTATAAALSGLQAGLQQVATARATIGVDEQTVSSVIADSNARITTLKTTTSNLVDADLAQLATNERLLTTQQQALVAVGSDLARLPLINILA